MKYKSFFQNMNEWFKPFRKQMAYLFAAYFLLQLVSAVIPWIMGKTVDYTMQQSYKMVLLMICLLTVVSLARSYFFGYLRERYSIRY
jgi:ABC-type bacteriocin/lantibiotic exporter with double-glycine peptidase domain